MSTFLVTGAAGFIGAAVAKKLIENGDSVITIDNLSTGFKINIPEGVVFIEGNDYDNEIIEKLDKWNFDAIIHIAGQSSGEVSFENPVYDLQTNVQSTLMLLNYAKQKGIKRFIYASSMSVYGDCGSELADEKSPVVPKSFYAVGKLASENYMRIFSNSFDIQCTALRFFNVYGIGQNMKNLKQGMASIYLAMAINNRHIVVKGSKDRFRDFVYIDDVVKAVIAALNRKNGNKYDYYNVCNCKKQTVESVIDVIKSNLPYDINCEFVEGTPGDQFGIYGDNQKIKKDLFWEPCIDFKTGMKMMIDWAQNLK